MSRTVLVATSSFGANDSSPRERLAGAGLELQFNPFGRRLSEAELIELMRRHRPLGIIAGLEPLTRLALESAAEHLKVISRCGVGMDSVDQDAAKRLGIRVFNTPEAPVESVAELAIALMLDCLRGVSRADRALRSGQWKALPGSLLGAKTVGVVGFGRIGRRVAELARVFGCRVLAHDAGPVAPGPEIEVSGLDELLAAADIVTLHVPLSPRTRGLIGAAELGRMRPSAVLINTARGGLVDEAALAQALRSGALSAAGLDVFDAEPYAGPLTDLPNVVLAPHMGSAAKECRVRMELEAVSNLLDGFQECGVL